MAVLYQAKGSKEPAVAGWNSTLLGGNGPALRSSSFFYKHIRLIDKPLTKQQMLTEVKQIWGDRNKSPATQVQSALGETRKKSDLYGKLKPPGNTTLFVTVGGFQEMNAYIEQHADESGVFWIPIPGGGTVVGVLGDKSTLTVGDEQFYPTGYWEISVEVGPGVAVGQGTTRNKLVYHFGAVAKSMQQIVGY
ncbi:MAG TPA: hypothetical protein VKA13_06665 [Gammaproteobacteria bacterium]|nr:hypothetical protein [Gammaproteobacteria bacterium]